MRKETLLFASSLVVATAGLAQVVPLGDEFDVLHSDTAFGPRVAIDQDGRFLALFDDVFTGDVVIRGFSGGALQTPFDITPGAREPSVAAVGPDDFAVVWGQERADPFVSDVLLQRFDTAGTALTSAQPVNQLPVLDLAAQTGVTVRPSDILVVWEPTFDSIEGQTHQVRARFVPFAGMADPPFMVNTSPADDNSHPRAAALPDGRTLIVWRADFCEPEDPRSSCIRARHFDASGAATGNDFLVNSTTAGTQDLPDVAAADDLFVVSWYSDDCGGDCLRVRRFDGDGVALGPDQRADEPGADFASAPGVGATGRGESLVVWARSEAGDSLAFGRPFDSDGQPLGGEFQVNSDPASEPYDAATAMNDAARFVVVWCDTETLWGRRFELGIFTDGFESGDTSAWDTTVP